MENVPLNYLAAQGAKALAILPLTKGLLLLSLGVTAIICALLLVALLRPRSAADRPLEQGGEPLRYVYLGVAVTSVALVGVLAWTLATVAAVVIPPSPPAQAVEISARQWWWRARYLDADPSRIFETANEIHVPVGETIRLLLRGDDVIHSFWVPALAGKTDVIPGQVNETWIRADRPGVYRGQCSEYCGDQHAHMGFLVVAQERPDFEAWREAQLRAPPAPPDGSTARAGMSVFDAHCAGCHTVRGTPAGGRLGPDLTHVASRAFIAAGALRNGPAEVAGWIADPQHVKPGAQMPRTALSGEQLQTVTAYLATLK